MTKTYNDVEAVTRLLEEKEKDLELAARIGQGLLSRNRALEERISAVESELSTAHDTVTQLRHDLSMKADLLSIYTSDYDDASPEGARAFTLETLVHKVRGLEVDNQKLRNEACQLARETSECEQREEQLFSDVLKQLSDANSEVKLVSEELAKKSDESFRQQEEITSLLAQLVDQRHKIKDLTLENEELLRQLQIVRQCQNDLAVELADYKDKYAEIMDLLRETQEQLRKQSRRHYSGGRIPGPAGSSLSTQSGFGSYNPDSLASELEFSSLGSELWGCDTPSVRTPRNQLQRIFDTVRCATQISSSAPLPTVNTSSGFVFSSQTRMSATVQPLLESPATEVAAIEQTDSAASKEPEYPGTSKIGVPGTPGTVDLTNALRRLEPRVRNSSGEKAALLEAQGWRTPDSIMSTGSRRSAYSLTPWKSPEKLKIVKPVEGSNTLNTWSRLATPHLGNLLEERPGVATRDTHDAAVGYTRNLLELYSLSDYEEEEEVTHPGKSFERAGTVYTYTNSTVMHPDDITQLTSSLQGTRMSAMDTMSLSDSSATATWPIHRTSTPPRALSRKNSVSTFSTQMSLAKALHERGTHPSTQNQAGSGLSTPCNSPGTSSPDSPLPYGPMSLLHRGARFFRRALTGEEIPVSQAVTKPKLVHADPKAVKNTGSTDQTEELGFNFIPLASHTVSPVILRAALENLKETRKVECELTLSTEGLTWSGSGATPPPLTDVGEIRIPGASSLPETFGPGYRRPVNSLRLGQPARPGMGQLQRLPQLGELPAKNGNSATSHWEKLLNPTGAAELNAKSLKGSKKILRNDLGTVGPSRCEPVNENKVVSFIGTLSSFLFGRKGGLL